jgi:hypothetical protein
MDQSDLLHWIFRPPQTLLIFALFLGCLVAVQTNMGKAWIRGGGWIYRAREPKRFWCYVAMYFLGGVGMIGYYFYLVN